MQTIEVIQGAAELLTKRSAWSPGVNARDRHGRPVPWHSQEATAFSVEGAFRRAAGEWHRSMWPEFRKLVAGMIGTERNLFDWEECPGRSHRDVINLLHDAMDAVRWAD